MTTPARARRAREGPALRRAGALDDAPLRDARAGERSAILALVDELAILAADLWFAEKLDNFPVHEESADAPED